MKNFTFSTDVQGFDYALANNDRFDTHDEALQAAIDFYNAYTGEVSNPWTIEHGCPRMMFVWDIAEETAKKEGAVSTDKATPGTWRQKGTMVSDSPESVGGMKLIVNELGNLVAYATGNNAALIAKAKVNAELVTELTNAAEHALEHLSVKFPKEAGILHELKTAIQKAKEAQR